MLCWFEGGYAPSSHATYLTANFTAILPCTIAKCLENLVPNFFVQSQDATINVIWTAQYQRHGTIKKPFTAMRKPRIPGNLPGMEQVSLINVAPCVTSSSRISVPSQATPRMAAWHHKITKGAASETICLQTKYSMYLTITWCHPERLVFLSGGEIWRCLPSVGTTWHDKSSQQVTCEQTPT